MKLTFFFSNINLLNFENMVYVMILDQFKLKFLMLKGFVSMTLSDNVLFNE